MRIVQQRREVFGWFEVVDDEGTVEWYLSPQAQVENGRRPINRYDSKSAAITVANAKGCKITWQTT